MKKILGKEYLTFLNEVKSRIVTSRIQAILSVNKELIRLYWDIGKTIAARQKKYKWGDAVIEQLACDLKEVFPGSLGFSERNLWNMRRFYEEYKDKLFLQQLVAEIPWGHNLLIADKDNIVVEYALRSVRTPMGVAEYYLTKKLPRYLVGKLPDSKLLKKSIEDEL